MSSFLFFCAMGTPLRAATDVPPDVWARIAPQLEANGVLSNLETKIMGSDSANNAYFGYSASIWGDVAVVGAYGYDSSRGAVYVFERNYGGTNAWGQSMILTAPGATVDDQFGHSVCVWGDVIVAGSINDDASGAYSGAAYVFERNEGGTNHWGLVKKLAIGSAGEEFGSSVGVCGDVIIVGAEQAWPSSKTYAGSAYVFERDAGGMNNWGVVKTLTAPIPTNYAYFGCSAAVDGDVVVVGSFGNGNYQGAGFVFERDAGGTSNWGLVKELTAPDGAAYDYLGWSAAVKGDVVALGAVNAPGGIWQGAVYVYERNAGGSNDWGQVAKLTRPAAATYDYFGNSVSIEGDWILVGAPGVTPADKPYGAGAAYLYERNANGTNAWGLVDTLTASDASSSAEFGKSVALGGGTALIGAWNMTNAVGVHVGAAYLIPIQYNETWPEKKTLAASTIVSGARFGNAVSLCGDLALVAAYSEPVGGFNYAGAAYLFERNTGGADGWGHAAKLTASDGAYGDNFGYSVCVDGDVAVVGAISSSPGAVLYAGAAYVFERNAGGANAWGQTAKLTAPAPAPSDSFGCSIGVAGDVVVVGAPQVDSSGVTNAGSAYVFERNKGGTNAWGYVTELSASDKATNDLFGRSVSVAGDLVLVGADQADPEGVTNAGAAYVFQRNAGGANAWGEVAKLTASDKVTNDCFGASVSLAGNTALVGAQNVDSAVGAAYVFERDAGGSNAWGQIARLMASDGAANDCFGHAVSLYGDAALVGAPWANPDTVADAGAAYVFQRNTGGANAWGQTTKLSASNKTANNIFGTSVCLWGNQVLAGAYQTDQGAVSLAGAAYLFAGTTESPGPALVFLGTNSAVVVSSNTVSFTDGTLFPTNTHRAVAWTNIFTITNSGGSALLISGVTTSGSGAAYFRVVDAPTSVAAGATALFVVALDTDSIGLQTAQVAIAHNGTDTPFVLNLAGAIDPDMMSIWLPTQQVNGVERNIFSRNTWTVRQILTDLSDILTGTNLNAIITRFDGWPDYPPAYTNGDLVALSNNLAYLLNTFPQSYSVYSNELAVGEMSYIDEYGNFFTTSNPGAYDPLPYTNTYVIYLEAGRHTAAAAILQALDNVELVTRNNRIRILASDNTATQTITFAALSNQVFGGTLHLSATSDSGLPVSFTNAPGAAITWLSATTITFQATGTVTIIASQTGSVDYLAAPMITNTCSVGKGTATVLLSNLSQVYNGTARTVGYSTTPTGLIVNITYGGNAWAPTNAGTYAVTGLVNDANWQGVSTGTLTVVQGTQVIDFPSIGRQNVTNMVVLSATASSGLPVTFSVVSGPAVITGGTNLTFTDHGMVTVRASQAGTADWEAALAEQTFRVTEGGVYLDFDGDGLADIACYYPGAGMWYILQSSDNTGRFQAWGWSNSIPVPGDYDGDGLYDIAVYAPESGTWHIWLSDSQTNRVQGWGWDEAIPVPGDYDGDGICDVAVYTPETGMWSIWQSSTESARFQAWGYEDAEPVPADYDGDGQCDLAVYVPESGTWLIWQSATQTARTHPWGWNEAEPIPGDYDGDGLADIGVYWPEIGQWYIWLSASQQMQSTCWGWNQALPVPADYDGDSKVDRTVYAPVYGMWYLWQSAFQTMRTQPWGFEEAEPVN